VKGVAGFEKDTYTQVTEARAKATQTTVDINDPASFAQFQANQGELSSALSRLMVTVEAYPQLKANENFMELQSQLEGTENRISVERKRYNEVVKAYNVFVRSFPTNFIANIF
jgi:LemA protein